MVPSSRSNYQLLHKIFLKHHSLIICFHQESRCPRIFTMNFNAFHVLCFCHKVYNKISFERVLGVKGVRKIKKAWAVQCARALKKGFAFLFSQDPFYPEDLNQRKSCYIWLTSAHQKNHLQVTRIQCFPKSLKTVFGNFLEILKRKLNGAGALQSRI